MREECATLAVKRAGWEGGLCACKGGGGVAGAARGDLQQQISRAWTPSLSLPLVRILLHCGKHGRTHFGLWRPQVPRTQKALVAQLCLVLLLWYR